MKTARALVTGASSGIGWELAKVLAARGVEVWVAARRGEELARLVEEIGKAGGKAHALVLDVSNADATYERLVALDREAGGIDLVIANAGLGGARGAIPASRCEWRDHRDLIQVNLLGSIATLTAFIPGMLARGHGQLVGISSVAADLPSPRSAPYGASKAGLTFFLESIDMELRPKGIAVTIIHPGFIRTPMAATLEDIKPFQMDVDRAARIIDRAIRRRARLVRFPWIMGAISRLARAMPRALFAPVILRLTAERPKAPPRPPA